MTSEETSFAPIFEVPYERNPHFTGRHDFLEAIHNKIRDPELKGYKHRIALFGLGGVGKTQIVLEYCFRYKQDYNYVFWVTAVDYASLLSGYQKIAIHARLKSLLNMKPVDIVEGVLNWLRREQSWLLVIDNLDDIKVVAGFLPQTGPHQHTLITTRNPNSTGIPAQGLEVPLLNTTESIDLLYALSNITITTNSPEREQAERIVQELGNLPLGIEQAAAYVREVAGNFTTFMNDYQQNRRDVYQWIPHGNRSYPHSVATT